MATAEPTRGVHNGRGLAQSIVKATVEASRDVNSLSFLETKVYPPNYQNLITALLELEDEKEIYLHILLCLTDTGVYRNAHSVFGGLTETLKGLRGDDRDSMRAFSNAVRRLRKDTEEKALSRRQEVINESSTVVATETLSISRSRVATGTHTRTPATSRASARGATGTSTRKTASPAESVDSNFHNDVCECCGGLGQVICCDTCNLVFHLDCTRPKLPGLPEGHWSCAYCVEAGTGVDNLEPPLTKAEAIQGIKDIEAVKRSSIGKVATGTPTRTPATSRARTRGATGTSTRKTASRAASTPGPRAVTTIGRERLKTRLFVDKEEEEEVDRGSSGDIISDILDKQHLENQAERKAYEAQRKADREADKAKTDAQMKMLKMELKANENVARIMIEGEKNAREAAIEGEAKARKEAIGNEAMARKRGDAFSSLVSFAALVIASYVYVRMTSD